MGSPISGLFADLVMDDLESECLQKLSFKPTFFYRYVDDIITCIPNSELNEMLNTFNSYNMAHCWGSGQRCAGKLTELTLG